MNNKQLMNSAFVGFKEQCGSQRSTLAGNTLLDLHNSSYPTQPHLFIAIKHIMVIELSGVQFGLKSYA